MIDSAKSVPGARHAFDLVAIDVDGTLLNSRGELSADVEAAIREARQQGIDVTLVSGRGRLPLSPWLRRLAIDRPYIGSGGSYIADPVSGEVIAHNPLTRENAALIVGLARAARVGVFFEEPDRLIGEAGGDVMRDIRALAGVEVFQAQDILQETSVAPNKIFLVGEHQTLVPIENELRRRNGSLHLTYSEPIYLEITRSGVNKGSALRQLADHLGIRLERIAVIGDGGNDVSMFEVAGLAVAMGNAAPEVQAAADVVAPTNDAGSVAWALRELILRR